jgi:hypothetical protein
LPSAFARFSAADHSGGSDGAASITPMSATIVPAISITLESPILIAPLAAGFAMTA